EWREQVRMAGKRVSQGLSGENARANLADSRTQAADIYIRRQQLQRIIEPSASLQQQREISSENADILSAHPLGQLQLQPLRFATALLDDAIDRYQPKIINASRDFRRGGSRNRSAHHFPSLSQRAIAEVRHCLTRPWSREESQQPMSPRRDTWPARRRTLWSCPNRWRPG